MRPASLPLNAREIYVTWWSNGSGLGFTASTDKAGMPYLGLYPLGQDGLQRGPALYFPRPVLITNIVVSFTEQRFFNGYVERQANIVYIDAEISKRKLEVRLIPPALKNYPNGTRRLIALWDDPKAFYTPPPQWQV